MGNGSGGPILKGGWLGGTHAALRLKEVVLEEMIKQKTEGMYYMKVWRESEMMEQSKCVCVCQRKKDRENDILLAFDVLTD